MAGSSMAFSYETVNGPIKKLIVDWVSDDTTGAVSGTTTRKINGHLIKGVTDPGAAAPSANYDITITDEEGIDVLGQCQGDLQNRHTTTSEQRYFFLKDYGGTPVVVSAFPVVSDLLTIAVANAGNSKNGQIIIYYREA